MTKRLIAIAFIFVCTSIAWMILGATVAARTAQSRAALDGKVESLWGEPQKQQPPSISAIAERQTANAKIQEKLLLPLLSTRANVTLDLDYRQKGLLWYSTYFVHFDATYRVKNTAAEERDIAVNWLFPAAKAVYENVAFTLNGHALPPAFAKESVEYTWRLAPGEEALFGVRYGSRGAGDWRYQFGSEVTQVSDFSLNLRTNFREIDFADYTLPPVTKERDGAGWLLHWKYGSLVSGYQVAVVMPEKLQPGPLAGQISFFAPVSLLFFFFMLLVITTLRNIELHPVNYFFLAAAFFAFHLLLAYLVDHISIHAAFTISSVVSILLVTSYLRVVVGPGFAFREAAVTQLIYLVLFSYAFFFKGYTGLAITIGAVLTLFVTMQVTARIRWQEKFRGYPAPA